MIPSFQGPSPDQAQGPVPPDFPGADGDTAAGSVPELLYNLLPAIYRSQDLGQGEPLRALLAVVEREFRAIHTDISGLYENLFIETCQEWIVPYIGQLLGVRDLGDQQDTFLSRRAEVANAIRYRRRKGSPAVLGYVVQDVTGWPARRVEYFDLLAVTQHLQHPRLGKGGVVDLRETARLERLGFAFDTLAYTAEVRLPAASAPDDTWRTRAITGKYNVPNIGLSLWRLQSYPLSRQPARQVREGEYTFHPLGVDTRLFHQPWEARDEVEVAQEWHILVGLRRRQLAEELEALRRALSQEQPRPPLRFAGPPVISIIVDGTPVDPAAVQVLDLGQWQRPSGSREYSGLTAAADGIAGRVELPFQVAIDPELGRLTFPEGAVPTEVLVGYSYGFSADLGGGPYPRGGTTAKFEGEVWRALVRQDAPTTPSAPAEDGPAVWYNNLQEAVAGWPASEGDGLIQIVDNGIYHLGEAPLEMHLAARRRLVVEAAEGRRPCLVGDISAVGQGPGAALTLDGLLLEGGLKLAGELDLSISHCTLNPRPAAVAGPSIRAGEGSNPELRMEVAHSIVGPVHLPPTIAGLKIADSIIDGCGGPAIAAGAPEGSADDFGPPTTLERATVFGPVLAHLVEAARDVIFTAPVRVQRRQQGYMRHCYVPPGSITPQCYNCQPDIALRNAGEPEERDQVLYRVRPSFTATVYGHPAYAQLDLGCPLEIRAGAEDGSEMGVFHHLRQPQRMARVGAALDEYLRHGLEAGLYYAS